MKTAERERERKRKREADKDRKQVTTSCLDEREERGPVSDCGLASEKYKEEVSRSDTLSFEERERERERERSRCAPSVVFDATDCTRNPDSRERESAQV